MKGDAQNYYHLFLLDFISCWQCVSIASATICERTFIGTHTFVTILISGIIYPIAASWVWGGGWLSTMGFIDHSGSGVIHLLGGTIGLIGTIF